MTGHLHDPGLASLRKATRVAVVLTGMTALGLVVLDSDTFTTFASFGSFALLGFANFAGPLKVRFSLGIGFTMIGAVLVAVGTLASGHLIQSLLLVGVVAFVMTFAGVFGGYPAAGGTGLILAVVLAVMIPGTESELASRVSGWVAAGLAGSVAMVTLWPDRPRPRVRLALASIAHELAGALRRIERLTVDELDAITEQILDLRKDIDASLARPSGPRSRDQALLYLLDELGRTTSFIRRLIGATPGSAPALSPSDLESLLASADVIDAAADVLAGSDADIPARRLEDLRARELAEVDERLTTLPVGVSGHQVDAASLVDRFEALFPVRMISYLALSMGAHALVTVGRDPGDTSFEFQPDAPDVSRGWRVLLRRTLATTRTHLHPRSRWFRNAVRAAIALAASVAVADLVQLDHAFWVVLGTLSVLRSSVMETGTSALQSVAGSILGFVLATGVMLAVGDNEALLWVVLPIVVMAAAYLPTAVSYLSGQAAFTVFIVVLFNLIQPVGWTLGIVRVERIMLGVAVSVVVALVIWPRGVTHDLAAAVAQEYRSATRYVRAALQTVLGRPRARDRRSDDAETIPDLEREAVARRSVAESEFGDLMNSRGSKTVDVDTWARLIARAHSLVIGADWLRQVGANEGQVVASPSSASSVRAAVAALEVAGDRVLRPYEELAARLETDTTGDAPPPSTEPPVPDDEDLREARACICAVLEEGLDTTGLTDRQTIALLWALQWASFLGQLEVELAGPSRQVQAGLRRPWWR